MPRGGNRTSPEARLRQARNERTILELRLCGAMHEDIAKQLGMSVNGVIAAYKRALRRIPEPVAQLARKESLERLDRLNVRLWTRLKREDLSHEDFARLSQTLLKAEQRHAKLLGLDAPEKLEVANKSDPEELRQRERHFQQVQKLTLEEKRALLEMIGKAKTADATPVDGADESE